MKIDRKSGELLLLLMAVGCAISFAVWLNLLNNFAIDRVDFDGSKMGILQSQIPGFLAFTIVFVLVFIKEQKMAYISLILLGIGTAFTGFLPTDIAFYATTMLMSVGFHYLETISNSLTLQWVDKGKSAEFFGKIIAARSVASIGAFTLVWLLFEFFKMDYVWVYIAGGSSSIAIAIFCWRYFDTLEQHVEQTKKIVLRKRYWLYYALQFMGGARRQIFVVFAGFLMVEKFDFSVAEISLLFLVNALLNIPLAPRIGRLIGKIGERKALVVEYIGLIVVLRTYKGSQNSSLSLSSRPPIFCHGYCTKNLFSKNCRPSRFRF